MAEVGGFSKPEAVLKHLNIESKLSDKLPDRPVPLEVELYLDISEEDLI